MYIDANACFTQSQGTTAGSARTIHQAVRPASTTADSTNIIDLEKTGRGPGQPVKVWCQVTQTYGSSFTSMKVGIYDCATEGGSYVLVAETAAIAMATLVAGYQFKLGYLPDTIRQFVKLTFTTAGGTPSAGTIAAGLVLDSQTNG